MSVAHGPERQSSGTSPSTDSPVSGGEGRSVDLETPARALAICAHPDDAEFFAAGTFAKWAAAGAVCTYLVLTDGSKGSWGDHRPEELPGIREDEQRRAAAVAGVEGVVFAGYEDGFLVNDLERRRDVALWIRRLRPDVLVAHDPWKRHRLHPDHREAGFVACDAVVAARESLVYADTDTRAHRPDHLLLFETDDPDHAEDITTTLDTKLAALLEHRSQYVSTMDIHGDDDDDGIAAFRERVTRWTDHMGAPFGLAHAEVFKTMRT